MVKMFVGRFDINDLTLENHSEENVFAERLHFHSSGDMASHTLVFHEVYEMFFKQTSGDQFQTFEIFKHFEKTLVKVSIHSQFDRIDILDNRHIKEISHIFYTFHMILYFIEVTFKGSSLELLHEGLFANTAVMKRFNVVMSVLGAGTQSMNHLGFAPHGKSQDAIQSCLKMAMCEFTL